MDERQAAIRRRGASGCQWICVGGVTLLEQVHVESSNCAIMMQSTDSVQRTAATPNRLDLALQ